MNAAQQWDELSGAMVAAWPVLEQTDNGLVVGSALHHVRVEHRKGGTDRIQLTVAVVERMAMSLERALMINADLTTGALCLVEGRYMLRHVLTLADATFLELDRVIGGLVNLAAAIRAQLRPVGEVSTDCFRHYQD